MQQQQQQGVGDDLHELQAIIAFGFFMAISVVVSAIFSAILTAIGFSKDFSWIAGLALFMFGLFLPFLLLWIHQSSAQSEVKEL